MTVASGKSEPDADVIVIGAGIIGISAAVEMQARGQKVMVLDKTSVAAGASQGNAGAFAFSDATPLASPGIMKKAPKWMLDPLGPLSIPPAYALKIAPWLYRFWRASRPEKVQNGIRALVALMQLSKSRLIPFMELSGTEGMLRRHGNLQLFENRKHFEETIPSWRARAAYGVEFTHLHSAGEIAEYQPGLSPKFVAATYTDDWYGISDPKDYTVRLGEVFAERGGDIRIGEAVGLTTGTEAATVALADGAKLRAKKIVVSSGAWSHFLAKTLGDHIPLETERGYNTTLPPGAFDLRRQLSFEEHGFVVSPLSSGVRVGGSVELGGLKLPPDFRRADVLLHKAKEFLPDLKLEGGRRWMGFRPSLPDSLPVIGPSDRSDKVIYAFGHGHLGLTQSAGTAALVSALVCGDDIPIDITPYSSGRF